MSAEKEIVNFWYNQHGYFTITNLKSKGNRDLGIIALRFENEKVSDAVYADVSCSISGSMADSSSDVLVNEICREKFGNAVVRQAIEGHLKNIPIKEGDLRHAMVLGNMPRSRKGEVIARFAQHGVSVIEFEDVLSNVMNGLDTQYYKNDVIRTMQLMKYLLLTDPKKMAQWFAPKPFQLIVKAMDFRPGGKFDMAMRGPDGNDFPFTGTYRVIAPPSLLSWSGEFTSGPAEQMSTTVSFEEEDGKTRLRARQSFFVMTPTIEMATKGANQGWNMTLDQLTEHLLKV